MIYLGISGVDSSEEYRESGEHILGSRPDFSGVRRVRHVAYRLVHTWTMLDNYLVVSLLRSHDSHVAFHMA